MPDKGRRDNSQNVYFDTIPAKSGEQAMLVKLDEITDMLKDLAAKLDADGGVTDQNYAELLTDAINKIELL